MSKVVSKLESYNKGDLVLISDHYSIPEKLKHGGQIGVIVSSYKTFDEILAMDRNDIEEFNNIKFYEVMYDNEVHFVTEFDILGKVL